MNFTISFQRELSLNIPKVVNNKDYQIYKALLTRINEILCFTGMDLDFAEKYVSMISQESSKALTSKQIKRYSRYGITALRCMIIKDLTGLGFRELSVRLAESTLLQWFCNLENIDAIRVPSKSQLQRYSVCVSEDYLRELIESLREKISLPENILNLKSPFSSEDIYLDATCLKANIHFPVDWLLLRDGMVSLLKSILVIRNHGLRHRMQPPEEFIHRVNILCIEMTNARRKPDSKKIRKAVLRQMKSLSKIIRAHGWTYYKLLKKQWSERTDLTEGQANEVLERINNVLTKLPEAIRQAHSRIITGLQIESKEKILSLFDNSARVVKRGKAGAEVEFGNTLFLAEQSDGFIVDWHLYEASAPSDSKMTLESIKRMTDKSMDIKNVAGDRGCDSKSCQNFLIKKRIENNICPRNPHDLIEKLQDKDFVFHQNRRSQTEGRIGIFKNNFTGSPIRNKKFEYKDISVAWSVLTHNLWVLARLEYDNEAALKTAA